MAMGRPRAFDAEKALDEAMEVFWRHGYDGATIAQLTKAMGINPPSLYAAFGDKEALFRKALDRYVERPDACMREALQQPTARGVTEQLLRGAANLLTDPNHPSGCLMVQSALVCGEGGDCIRQELISRRLAGEAAVRRRFQRARAEDDLPADSNPADLARYVMTVSQGMAVQAAGGTSRKELYRVVATAMGAWPQ